MIDAPDLVATCFDCERPFKVTTNDRICPGCREEERARNRHKTRPSNARRPRSLAPIATEAPALPSLAMRLHGRRLEKGGKA